MDGTLTEIEESYGDYNIPETRYVVTLDTGEKIRFRPLEYEFRVEHKKGKGPIHKLAKMFGFSEKSKSIRGGKKSRSKKYKKKSRKNRRKSKNLY